MHPKKNKLLFFVVALLFAVSSGCSRKVLSVFFDGVPDPADSSHRASIVSEKAAVIRPDTVTAKENPVPIASANRSIHPPFQLKKCSLCHDVSAKAKLVLPQPALCYLCHDDFKVLYKFVHAPADSGSCTTCHNPHVSENKNLLLKTGQQICLTCHNANQIFSHKAHQDIKATDCIECHNPHGGKNKFFTTNSGEL